MFFKYGITLLRYFSTDNIYFYHNYFHIKNKYYPKNYLFLLGVVYFIFQSTKISYIFNVIYLFFQSNFFLKSLIMLFSILLNLVQVLNFSSLYMVNIFSFKKIKVYYTLKKSFKILVIFRNTEIL